MGLVLASEAILHPVEIRKAGNLAGQQHEVHGEYKVS